MRFPYEDNKRSINQYRRHTIQIEVPCTVLFFYLFLIIALITNETKLNLYTEKMILLKHLKI